MRRHWQGFLGWRERFRFTEEALHLLIAGGIGIIGGVVNVVFVKLIVGCQDLVWAKGNSTSLTPFQGTEWERLLIPVAGGLIAGFLLYLGVKWSAKKGSNNLLEAVSMGDGKLPFGTAVSQAFSSVVSIVSGATIGREGSITQFTSMLASKWGALARFLPTAATPRFDEIARRAGDDDGHHTALRPSQGTLRRYHCHCASLRQGRQRSSRSQFTQGRHRHRNRAHGG